MQYRSTILQTISQHQICLHLNTEIKIKRVESVKNVLYAVLVILDLVVDDVAPPPESSGKFPNFFINDSRILKSEITIRLTFFSPTHQKSPPVTIT